MKKRGFLDRLLGGRTRIALPNLDNSAREMIQGIAELSQTNVREIMVPRIDVVSVSLETARGELLEIVAKCGHSRLPVYHETIDNVVGVLYAKDLLRALMKDSAGLELEKIIRPAYFVPESKKLDSLLREFQRRRVHIAMVVDEFGGTSGIVSLEDIIEEIVGEIQDEFDHETEDILKLSDGAYLCDGRVKLETLNEQIGLQLPEADYDTLGGFVFDLCGKIPVKYEKMSHRNIDFIIQHMEGNKINTVKIVIHPEKTKEEK